MNKLTVADIDKAIKNIHYHHHDVLTVCIVTLQNDYHVVGKSAPADRANFNKAYGQELALTDARRQIWALEGYVLRNTIKQREDHAERLRARKAQIYKDETFRTFWLNRIANPFWNARESQ
jgi:hypothetical protein